ncbi:MAG: caspase family protein [Candidatus Krumholzibacteriia bacterium]
MKKLFLLISAVTIATFGLVGCSEDGPLSPPSGTQDGSVFQRPEFIDTRPPEVQAQFTLTAADAVIPMPSTEKAGGKYALVIGISDYAGTANDLQYCDDDGRDWRDRLIAEGYSVTLLLDGQATKAAIEAAVSNLVSLSIAGNEIAFTYSGHGSRGNLISADLYYISSSWFGTMFANVASTKMAFAFDACQIGAFGTALNQPGRVVALASDTRRYSYDGDATMQNGVFTYYQMLGFDQQGFVFYEADCQYACDMFLQWASQYRGIKVAPSYLDTYAGDLDL